MLHDSWVPAFQPDLQSIQDNLAQAAVEVASPDMIVSLIPPDGTCGHHVEIRVDSFKCRQDFYAMIVAINGFFHSIRSYATVLITVRS
jgi:hypothetical protein